MSPASCWSIVGLGLFFPASTAADRSRHGGQLEVLFVTRMARREESFVERFRGFTSLGLHSIIIVDFGL